MNLLHSTCRSTFAIVGIVAVLWGALVQEALATKANGAAGDARAGDCCAHLAENSDLAAWSSPGEPEGIYRLENYPCWTAPATSDGPFWRIHAPFAGEGRASVPLHLAQQTRSRLRGEFALRL